MAGRGGFFGGFGNIFNNDEVLWFIILFLLLFWGWRDFGYCGDPKVTD